MTFGSRERSETTAHDDRTDPLDDLPALPDYNRERASKREEYHGDTGYYGVMYGGDYKWDAARTTAEAYGDGGDNRLSRTIDGQRRRSLYYHSVWLSPGRAAECLTEIGTYNRFEATRVGRVLVTLDVPTVVAVGREGSVVLYLWTTDAAPVMDRLSAMAPPTAETWTEEPGVDATAGNTSPVFAPAGPDELGARADVDRYPVGGVGKRADELPDGYDAALIRAWWD